MKLNVLFLSDDDSFLFETIAYHINDNLQIDAIPIRVTNIDEAIDMLERKYIHLIVSDIDLNPIECCDFVDFVKKDRRFDAIPLVLISENEALKGLAYAKGIKEFFLKPIHIEELLSKFSNILSDVLLQKKVISELFDHKNSLKKANKKIDSLKKDMVVIFTHELKTPLNAIISFSSYIGRNLNKELTPKRVNKLIELSKQIELNGHGLLSQINNLLDISKMKNNKMPLNLKDIDLKEFINSILNKYSGMYGKMVTSNLDDGVVLSDENSLLSIIDNIYSNALKYSNSKILLTLKYDKDMFFLNIEDDGRGIPECEHGKIFELFEQTDETVLTREHEGTGIGLYIVKLLCDRLNYGIAINNSNLGGANFCISGKIKGE
jgi:signal transduction histidine kinase